MAAAFVWGPLLMAPPFADLHPRCVTGGQIAYNHEYQQMRDWITSMGGITDWALVAIGLLQWRVYVRQAAILDKQTTLNHQNYLLTHRPKLRVRNIVIKSSLFARGQIVHGQFYVDNIGGTNAYITESHCEFLWNVNGLPMERPYEGKDGNNPIAKNTLIVGSVGVAALFSSAPNLYPDLPPPGTEPTNRAFFMGWIEYLDDTGLKRRTIFCREFLQRDGSARFWPAPNDPDYEYEQ